MNICRCWKTRRVFHLESKADAEDEGGDGGDEPREESVEGEGAHLVDSSLKLLCYFFKSYGLFEKKSFIYETDQATVEELEDPGEEDVGQVGINDLQLPEKQV